MANRHKTPLPAADIVACNFFEAITEAIIEEDRVEIRGFGAFSGREYDAYTGRNPRTGELVAVNSKRLPFFKVSRELPERRNRGR